MLSCTRLPALAISWIDPAICSTRLPTSRTAPAMRANASRACSTVAALSSVCLAPS
jgi:hypothetical protein